MKNIAVLFAFFIFITSTVKGQSDAQYSQYMFNGIYINPAYAGYKEQLNIHSFYRNQWTGINGAPKSTSIAVDAIANNGNVGLALQIASDKLGAQSSLSAYANYAYRLRIGSDESSRLAFGVGVGAVQNGLDGNKLDPTDLGDSRIPVGMQSDILPDAKAGVYYANDRLYLGFSVNNLIMQYVAKKTSLLGYFPVQKPHFYLTGGILLPVNEQFQFKPSFLLKDDLGGATSLDLNAFALLAEKVWLGFSYRTAVSIYNKPYLQSDLRSRNSITGMTEYYIKPELRIGYAYDHSLNKLAAYSGGSHEISVAFFIKAKKTRMLSPRYF